MKVFYIIKSILSLKMRKDSKVNWKLGFFFLLGKIIGIILVIAIVKFLPGIFISSASAAETYSVHETSIINTINTVWTLVAAFLVFGMQAGFIMLEAGFARTKETVNVLMECVFDTCICGILFYAIGYAFMFSHGNGFIGFHWFFLNGAPDTYETTGIPLLAHWIFQFAFADTCSTITSGAMIGRTGFRGDILYSLVVTGFLYPIIGHWAWGPDGFLATIGSSGNFFSNLGTGFRDFAGSTVVHTIGGVVSLAGAIVLGPRLGRIFQRDDQRNGGMPAPHNLTLASLGAFLLWFGWYGFNAGSTLSAMDLQGIGRVAANTTLAACAGGLTAMLGALWFGNTKGKFDLSFTINGLLGGLVAITCPCYWVSPVGAILLGLIAGFVVYFGVVFLEYCRIDDPVGAVSVHGFAGIWGTISLGLFACGRYGLTGPTGGGNTKELLVRGLFYGGGTQILYVQILGSLIITLATFGMSLIIMFVISKLPQPWSLRIPKEVEISMGGVDVFEHGVTAYPEQENLIFPSEFEPLLNPVKLENQSSLKNQKASKEPVLTL